MKINKVLFFIVSVLMSMSQLTTVSAIALPATGDRQEVVDSKITALAQEVFQENGWPGFDLRFYSTPNSVVTAKDWLAINQSAVNRKLAGSKSPEDGNQYSARRYFNLKGYNQPYYIRFAVLLNSENSKVKAAWIELGVLYKPSANMYVNKFFPIGTEKSKTDQIVRRFYAKKNAMKPVDSIAENGSFAGYQVGNTENTKLNMLFKNCPVASKDMVFYESTGNYVSNSFDEDMDLLFPEHRQYYAKFLSQEHYVQIDNLATKEGVIEKARGNYEFFSYSEKKYYVDSKKELAYYVDFCAVAITAKKTDYITWLIVKPSKINKEGVIDMYIYSANTKKEIINADMKRILSATE